MGGADSGLWGRETGKYDILQDLCVQRGSQTRRAAGYGGGMGRIKERHCERGAMTVRQDSVGQGDRGMGWDGVSVSGRVQVTGW